MDNTIQLYLDKEKQIKGYPITSPDRVIDENGVNIKERLDDIAKHTKGFINVENYKELVEGDNWTYAIKEAVKNAVNSSKGLFLPSGEYKVTETIDIPNSIHIKGMGKNRTKIIKLNSFEGAIFYCNRNGLENNHVLWDILIEGIHFNGFNSLSKEGGAIVFERCTRCTVKDVEIRSFNGNGITTFGRCDYLLIDDTRIQFCSKGVENVLKQSDSIGDISDSGKPGYNLRCGLVTYTDVWGEVGGGLSGTADIIITGNSQFMKNDIGIRSSSVDTKISDSSIQTNYVYDCYLSSTAFINNTHFECWSDGDDIRKVNANILQEKGGIYINNCSFWGNSNNFTTSAIEFIGGISLFVSNCIMSYYPTGVFINNSEGIPYLHFNSRFLPTSGSTKKSVDGKVNRGYILEKNYNNTTYGDFVVNGVLGSNDERGIVISNSIYPLYDSNLGVSDKPFKKAYIETLQAKNWLEVDNSNCKIMYCKDSPEGVLVSTKGSLCITETAGVWYKSSGWGTNTGWVQLQTIN